MNEHFDFVDRPPSDYMHLATATIISKGSMDAQTQCGCVLVKRNRIVATGCNSPARDLPNSLVPNLRPHKYPWMIHAEKNAISNALLAGVATEGCVAYINARPCFTCLSQELWHNRIREVRYYDGVKPTYSEEDEQLTQEFMRLTNGEMKVYKLQFDFSEYIREYHESAT